MNTLRVAITALALACSASLALAQTANPPADANAAKPDNMAASEANEKPPLAGANSFTEAQARERIAEAGFDDVKALKQDDKGIWRGQAMKSGQQVEVALDYRGNVVQQ
jgi:hypothetical protein